MPFTPSHYTLSASEIVDRAMRLYRQEFRGFALPGFITALLIISDAHFLTFHLVSSSNTGVLLLLLFYMAYSQTRSVAHTYLGNTAAFFVCQRPIPLFACFMTLLPMLAMSGVILLVAETAITTLHQFMHFVELEQVFIPELRELLKSWIVTLVILLIIVPMSVRILIAGQILLLEGKTIQASFLRSWELTGKAGWHPWSVSIIIGGFLVAVITLSGTITLLAFILPIVRMGESGVFALLDRVPLVVAALLLPFQITALTVLYYDVRVRHEGFDLEVAQHQSTHTHIQALYERSRHCIDEEQYSEALHLLDEGLHLWPESYELISLRMQARSMAGDLVGFAADRDRALSLAPRDTDLHMLLARLARRDKKFAAAWEHYHQVLQHDPGHQQALQEGSHALFELGRYAEALECVERLLRRNPDNALALYNAACGYAFLGKHDLALQRLEAALGVDEQYRDFAATDNDFASLRTDLRFQQLMQPKDPTTRE